MAPETEPTTDPVRAITRREAIRRAALLLGGAALIGCSRTEQVEAVVEKAAGALPEGPIGQFSLQDIAYLDEIAETILPATKTPGAKAAKCGAFMALMVTDCYAPDEQKTFRDGMRRVDEAAQKTANASFMRANPQQRLAVLSAFDRQAHREAYEAEAEARKRQGLAELPPYEAVDAEPPAVDTAATPPEPATFFRMMKELTLLGFFTSEIGCTQVLRYVPVPGRYDPCAPYQAGTPAWAI